jgi:hypothetical protein
MPRNEGDVAELAPPRVRRQVAWGLLGMLGLVAAAESFVSRNALWFMNSSELDWMSSGRATAKQATPFEVLCFGDSMLKFGIAPRVLEAKLGKRVYNFAVLDGKPVVSFLLFRRALEAGARPEALVVDFAPEALNQIPAHLLTNPNWNALLASPREAWELAWSYRDREFFGHLVLARVLPSFRCRGQLRAAVVAALQGQVDPNPENNRPLLRNRDLNSGGILLAKQPGFQGEIPPQWKFDLLSPDFVIKPEHAHYIRSLFRLAAEYNIAVYWLMPPNAVQVIAVRDGNGVHGRYDRFARRMLAQFPNVSVIDARHAGYGNSVFVDPVHLDRDGATVLSGDVADVLQNALCHSEPVPRWVELPAYHGRPAIVRLEDVDQSRTAMRRGAESRWR